MTLMLEVLAMSERLVELAKLAPPEGTPRALAQAESTIRLAERDMGAFESSGPTADERVGLNQARERIARIRVAMAELMAPKPSKTTDATGSTPVSDRVRIARKGMLDALDGAERLLATMPLTHVTMRPRVMAEVMCMIRSTEHFVSDAMQVDSEGRPLTLEDAEHARQFASRVERLTIQMAELSPSHGQA